MEEIDAASLIQAISNFVTEFDQSHCYQFYGSELGQSLLDQYGAGLYKLGSDPITCFAQFVVENKFKPYYKEINAAFLIYYKAVLSF